MQTGQKSKENFLPVIAVVGPTATGKSALAIELAKVFGAEIVSADSKQIYQDLHIGTAVPDLSQREGIQHHLMQFVPRDEEFSVAKYALAAKEKIREIHERKKVPILVGGTGLYIDAVLKNMQFHETKSDPTLRKKLEQTAEEKGGAFLLETLQGYDPELAQKLHPNNLGRIIRAIEVYEQTGIPMSEMQKKALQTPPEYATCMLGLSFRDRQKLYERIDKRVLLMLQEGLLEELRSLSIEGLSQTARQSIGYKEFFAYLQGEESLEEAVEKTQRQTRRYAKRQLTWFGKNPLINWLYIDDFERYNEIVPAAAELVKNKLGLPSVI